MPIASGKVKAVKKDRRAFNTKYGEKYHASFKMDDEQWYTLPFCNLDDADPINSGDVVEFMYVEKQNGQYTNRDVDKKSLNIKGATPQEFAAPVEQGGSPAPAPAAPRVDNRQQSIHYQSSRKDALLFVQVALANECAPLPAKKADRLDALEALVDSFTEKFYSDVENLGKPKPEPEVEAAAGPEDFNDEPPF